MEEILSTILKEIRELNVKVDALLASSGGTKKSITGMTQTVEDDFTDYLRQLAKKHKQFPGLNKLSKSNLEKYKNGELSIEKLLASIGSLYSKRKSFYNLLKDLKILSNGKYDFVRERED